MSKARRNRAATFTKAELQRYGEYLKSVGERFGGVEKRPGGVVRLLTASEVEAASPGEESDAIAAWDKALGIQ